jgi:hypothetical protein
MAKYRLAGESVRGSSDESSSAGCGDGCSGSRRHCSGLYIDGFNDCDVDKFKQAFHEDAWIFFTYRDATLYKGLIADPFEEWATPPAQRIVGRVISLTHAKVSLGSKGAMGTARLRRA